VLSVVVALSATTMASATTVGGVRADDLLAFVADGPEDPASTVTVSDTSGSFYWWVTNRNRERGAWRADFTYTNDWIRHKFLRLEVTSTLASGEVLAPTTATFYVPATGSTTFTVWDNDYEVSGGNVTGVVAVSVRVTRITTYTESWQPLVFDVDGPEATVTVPPTP
jgi:hypothetical protein